MTTTYEIQVIQCDRRDRMSELSRAVATELVSVGLHRTVAVAVGEGAPMSATPSVATLLASPGAVADPGIQAAIAEAVNAGRVVIPVVDDLADFVACVPPSLALVNGFAWAGPDAAQRLARLLLEELGIEDRQRRVFISHKRDDGLGAAEQLYDRLSHSGFVPFIDRFAIRSGQQVQETIADALEDYAFILLLETPLAHTSAWVFDEVDYAISHSMGTLIVRWPDDPELVPGSKGLPRVHLSRDELISDEHDYDILTDSALDALVGQIEGAHAHGLVRRRRMLVRSIEEAAAAVGCTSCSLLPGWRLLVEHAGESTLLGVTPRLPTAEDLQALDQARSLAETDRAAVLVHSARVLREHLRRHLAWVAGDRDLILRPENAIGGHWI